MVVRRLWHGVLTLLLVSGMVFFFTQALPGDAAQAILGRDADPERLAALRERLGLTQGSVEQYVDWLTSVLRGDLGESLVNGRPVIDILSERLVSSLYLVLVAAAIGIPVALAVGVWSGWRRDSAGENVVSNTLLLLIAVPEFVIGIGLVLLLATGPLKLFPPVSLPPVGDQIWTHPELVVLPALTLIAAFGPYVARMTRASVVEVLETPYIEMARLKGIHDRELLRRHVLPNAIAPAIQVTALQLAWLAGGVVVVEYVFAYRGLGTVLVDAAANRDVPVVQALTLLAGTVYVLLNLVADLGTVMVTPRLRTSLQGQRAGPSAPTDAQA